MPNEKVSDYVSQGWYTEVSWRRRPGLDPDDQGTAPGHVQVATVNAHSPFEFPEREHGTSWEAGERFDGWRVTLDEAGIDRLIKTLHKAKRQAFGEPHAEIRPPNTHRMIDDLAITERSQSIPRIIGDSPDPNPPLGPLRVIGDDRIIAAERGAWIPEADGGGQYV